MTVFDDGINKQVQLSPNYEKTALDENDSVLTENLEETIRNSVKNEIEMEQTAGSSTIIEALKDIPEPEVRQKITEELMGIEHVHQLSDQKETVRKEDDEQQQEAKIQEISHEDIFEQKAEGTLEEQTEEMAEKGKLYKENKVLFELFIKI